MGTIYVLGAGFSKTCGIALDTEMLDRLNPYLDRESRKGGSGMTAIDYVKSQNFPGEGVVGFEIFMSTLSALKFLPEFAGIKPNVFQDSEQEIRKALKHYLADGLRDIRWDDKRNSPILDFVKKVAWGEDTVLTFNYDLLLESAARYVQIDTGDSILHLHGAVNERRLAWPTYKKFAYRNTRTALGIRWNRAFEILRNCRKLERIVFIGYSMPPTDLEAKGLFNYTDWYNQSDSQNKYEIAVVNPDQKIIDNNYAFFRQSVRPYCMTLAEWIKVGVHS